MLFILFSWSSTIGVEKLLIFVSVFGVVRLFVELLVTELLSVLFVMVLSILFVLLVVPFPFGTVVLAEILLEE